MTKPATSATIDTGQALASGLVGLWLFNEGSGTANDYANNNDAAQASGTASWVTDVNGDPAISTASSHWHIDGGTNTIPAALQTNNQTIAAYVYYPSLTFNAATFAFGDAGGLLFAHGNGSASNWLFYRRTSNWDSVGLNASTYMTASNWHWVVQTYDGANIKVYIDGTERASKATTGNLTYSAGGQPSAIGRYYADVSLRMSFLGIWNRALSSAEVSSLIASPYQMIASGGSTTDATAAAAVGVATANTLTGSSAAASSATAAAGAATTNTVAATALKPSAATAAAGAATAGALTGSSIVAASLTAAVGTSSTAATSAAFTSADMTAAAGLGSASATGSAIASATPSAASGASTAATLVGSVVGDTSGTMTPAAGVSTAGTLAGSSIAAATLTPATAAASASAVGSAITAATITPAAGVSAASTLATDSSTFVSASAVAADGVATTATLQAAATGAALLAFAQGSATVDTLTASSIAAASLVPAAGTSTASASSGNGGFFRVGRISTAERSPAIGAASAAPRIVEVGA